MKTPLITLVAQQDTLEAAWVEVASGLDFVTVYRGSIFDVQADAYISPANSFGFLNGGIDLHYARHFGPQLETRLQEAIRKNHHGELLVGCAEIVPTDSSAVPYLIAAPTMRMPMSVRYSVNAYLAMRAALLLWKYGEIQFSDGNKVSISEVVRSIATPGLCTGVGSMAADVCGRQVRAAIDHILLEKIEFPAHWGGVLQQHEEFLGHEVPNL